MLALARAGYVLTLSKINRDLLHRGEIPSKKKPRG